MNEKFLVLSNEEKVIDGLVYRQVLSKPESLKRAFGVFSRNLQKGIEVYKEIDMNEVEVKEKV